MNIRRVVVPAERWPKVVEQSGWEAWYAHIGILPRAFSKGHTIYVKEGHENNVSLMAHERGHLLLREFFANRHPSPASFDYYVDVMGVLPIRLFDRYKLKPGTREWLAELKASAS